MVRVREGMSLEVSGLQWSISALALAALCVASVVGSNFRSNGYQTDQRMLPQEQPLRGELRCTGDSDVPCENRSVSATPTERKQGEVGDGLIRDLDDSPGGRKQRITHLAQFPPRNGANAGPLGAQANGPGAARNRNTLGNSGRGAGAMGGNGQGGVCINPTVRLADQYSDRLSELRLNALRSLPTESNLFSD